MAINQTDAKVEGYLVRAKQVIKSFAKSEGWVLDEATMPNIIKVAKMIQREENPAVYVMNQQVVEPGSLRTYLYVGGENGEIEITVDAPDFESAIPLVIKSGRELYDTEILETSVRASLTRLE